MNVISGRASPAPSLAAAYRRERTRRWAFMDAESNMLLQPRRTGGHLSSITICRAMLWKRLRWPSSIRTRSTPCFRQQKHHTESERGIGRQLSNWGGAGECRSSAALRQHRQRCFVAWMLVLRCVPVGRAERAAPTTSTRASCVDLAPVVIGQDAT